MRNSQRTNQRIDAPYKLGDCVAPTPARMKLPPRLHGATPTHRKVCDIQ